MMGACGWKTIQIVRGAMRLCVREMERWRGMEEWWGEPGKGRWAQLSVFWHSLGAMRDDRMWQGN